MAKDDPSCPVCNRAMKPTWFKELGSFSGGGSPRRIPMDLQCPDNCAQTVDPHVYNAAIRARDKARADSEIGEDPV